VGGSIPKPVTPWVDAQRPLAARSLRLHPAKSHASDCVVTPRKLPPNDGWYDITYELGDDAVQSARVGAVLNEACHVFHCHAGGSWKAHDKDAYARLLTLELSNRPGLAGRLLATENQVVKMLTHRALELLKVHGTSESIEKADASAPRYCLREFRGDEVSTYRELRLAALRESPDAFCTTLEQALRWENWEERLQADMGSPLERLLLVQVQGVSAGMALGSFPSAEATDAQVYQLWVDARFRRHGLAAWMLRDLMAWAKLRGAVAMALSVACKHTAGSSMPSKDADGQGTAGTDMAAAALYRRLGFRDVGEPEPLRPGILLQAMRREL